MWIEGVENKKKQGKGDKEKGKG